MSEERTFYHVDSAGALVAGQTVEQIRGSRLDDALSKHVRGGVSLYGKRTLLSGLDDRVSWCHVLYWEGLAEYIRQTFYPERPSRLASLYACASVNDARQFAMNNPPFRGKIWEVEAKGAIRCDQGYAGARHVALLGAISAAHCYWQSKAGSSAPFWEYLLPLPVRVKRLVCEVDFRPPDRRGALTDDS